MKIVTTCVVSDCLYVCVCVCLLGRGREGIKRERKRKKERKTAAIEDNLHDSKEGANLNSTNVPVFVDPILPFSTRSLFVSIFSEQQGSCLLDSYAANLIYLPPSRHIAFNWILQWQVWNKCYLVWCCITDDSMIDCFFFFLLSGIDSWLFCCFLYNTIQYNTIQYNMIQHNTIQYNTRKNKTKWKNTRRDNIKKCNTVQHDKM